MDRRLADPRGHLRQALTLFLGTLIGSLALVNMYTGLRGLVIDPTFPVLSLVLGGLVLGRGALWKILGCLLLSLALAALSDVLMSLGATQPAPYAPNWAPSIVMLCVMIAVVLDQTLLALLRSSLDKASPRSGRTDRVARSIGTMS